jgi:catalase
LTNQPIQDKNTLAQVLSKINALSQKKNATNHPIETASTEKFQSTTAVPVLTEVYEGDIFHGTHASEEVETDSARDGLTSENLYSFLSDEQDHGKIVKKIMAEIQPMINAAVKEALIHELAVAEVKLLTSLEKDLNAVLKLKLESILKP